MCLVLVGWRAQPGYPLVVAANRDEYHSRRSTALTRWPEVPGLLAGRDLDSGDDAGGTWIGVREIRAQQRFAAVTNVVRLGRSRPGIRSRGSMPRDFLTDTRTSPSEFARSVGAAASGTYDGYNLLISDLEELWWCGSGDEAAVRRVVPGFHGVANDERLHSIAEGSDDSESETVMSAKVKRALTAFRAIVRTDADNVDRYFELLSDRTPVTGKVAAVSGMPPGMQRLSSARFIANKMYGTRSSTVIFVREGGSVTMVERTYDRNGQPSGQTRLEGVIGDAR